MLVKLFLFLSIAFLSVTEYVEAQTGIKVWVDTDIKSGKLSEDVDDALAILYLLNDSNVIIKGFSTVMKPDYSARQIEKILNWEESQISVYEGTKEKVFPEKSEAVIALTEALSKESMYVLALGPLTNIANLLYFHPELKDSISGITFCAGRRKDERFNPGNGNRNFSDYNFEHDIEAAKNVLASGIAINLSGFTAAKNVKISRKDIQLFNTSNLPGRKWLGRKMKWWERWWRWFFKSKEGFYPFDAVTAAALVRPYYFSFQDMFIQIKVAPNDTKSIIKSDEKPYLVVNSEEAESLGKVRFYSNAKLELKTFLMEKWLEK